MSYEESILRDAVLEYERRHPLGRKPTERAVARARDALRAAWDSTPPEASLTAHMCNATDAARDALGLPTTKEEV